MNECPCIDCLILPLCKSRVKNPLDFIERMKNCSLLFDFLECDTISPTSISWIDDETSERGKRKLIELKKIIDYEIDFMFTFPKGSKQI